VVSCPLIRPDARAGQYVILDHMLQMAASWLLCTRYVKNFSMPSFTPLKDPLQIHWPAFLVSQFVLGDKGFIDDKMLAGPPSHTRLAISSVEQTSLTILVQSVIQ